MDYKNSEGAFQALEGLSRAPFVRRILVQASGTAGRVPPGVHAVEAKGNPGFAHSANQGAALGAAPFLLFLNPDCFLTVGQLEDLLHYVRWRPKVAAVSPQLRGHSGVLQRSSGRDLDQWARLWDSERRPKQGIVDWVAGTCMLVRRRAFEAVGGFDTGYFLYCEDADLCRRMRRLGWKSHQYIGFCVPHEGGASSASESLRQEQYRKSRKRYMKRFGSVFIQSSWNFLQRISLWRSSL